MSSKITNKITGYSVKNPELKSPEEVSATKEIRETLGMTPVWERPLSLPASVYKIRKCHNTPEAAVYVTISDTEVNGKPVPVEVFINSQDVSHQQWTAALTRIISAMFRQGGDCSFIAEELLQIHDPKGGCFQNGKFYPSLVSQVGGVLKTHLENLKVEKSAKAYGSSEQASVPLGEKLQKSKPEGEFPPNATLCPTCSYKSVVVSDGCSLCLNCGASKCN